MRHIHRLEVFIADWRSCLPGLEHYRLGGSLFCSGSGFVYGLLGGKDGLNVKRNLVSLVDFFPNALQFSTPVWMVPFLCDSESLTLLIPKGRSGRSKLRAQ